MRNAQRYPFISSDPTLGEASFCPYLPFSLVFQQTSIAARVFSISKGFRFRVGWLCYLHPPNNHVVANGIEILVVQKKLVAAVDRER